MKFLWDLFVYTCICFLFTCVTLAFAPQEKMPHTTFEFTPLYIGTFPPQKNEVIPLPPEFQKNEPSEVKLVNFLICAHNPPTSVGVLFL